MASEFEHQAVEATDFVTDKISSSRLAKPQWAIVLGSGMGAVAKRIEVKLSIDYRDIPNFRGVTVAGHGGSLLLGKLAGRDVVVMSGRYHFYEGHPIQAMTLPIEVMSRLGATSLLVSNAAGGVNPSLEVGDLLAIEDLICTWQGFGLSISADHPGIGSSKRGQLFDRTLIKSAATVARRNGFTLRRGCYHATTGPTYETRAEYRMMRRLGIDVVGMSTAAEVLHAAIHCNMRVLAISMVSNVAKLDSPQQTSHDDVVQAGRAAGIRIQQLLEGVLAQT